MPYVISSKYDRDRGVQSVLFDKSKWSVGRARLWLINNGFQHLECDYHPNTNYYRFRQFNPKHSDVYRTHRIAHNILLIYNTH